MGLEPEALLSCESGQEAPKQVLSELPESQAGPERHRCCHCAFQYGLQDARQGWQPTSASHIRRCKHGKVARLSSVEKIHENQGGVQRHKCAVCAYAKGFHFDEESLFAYEESKTGNGGLIVVEPPDISTDKKMGFIITANELEFARQNRKKYKIYRIFEFNPNSNSGSVFYLSVKQLEKMRLTPLQYKCEF